MTAYDDGSVWDAFGSAVLRIDAPEGEVEIQPGCGAPHLPWDEPVHLVTGWNPGRLASDAENEVANRALKAHLEHPGRLVFDAVGASADGSWAEPGFAVVGLTRTEAVDTARGFGQLAIYEVTRSGAVVIDCR